MSDSPPASSESSPAVPPPRLHVLLRPEVAKAVVLRRGGSKVYCAIGWDLSTDGFSVGQWCKHKIYPRRCDLSPDGRWMVYFALNGHWDSEVRGSWTAVSRAPYLKAVCLAPQGDTWGGGGLFVSDGKTPSSGLGRLFASVQRSPRFRLATGAGAGYQDRLQRDGWRLGSDGFEKALGKGWTLHKILGDEPKEQHRLRATDGRVIDLPQWEWADLDAPRRRIVWAEAGSIRCAPLTHDGIGPVRELFDARPMAFEPIPAPYDDETLFVPPRA